MITIKNKITVALLSSGFAMQPVQGEVLPYRPETLTLVPIVPYAQARAQAIFAGGIGMLGFAIFKHLGKTLIEGLFPDRPLPQCAAHMGFGFCTRLMILRIFQQMEDFEFLGAARWDAIRDALPGVEQIELAPFVAGDDQLQEQALEEIEKIDSELSNKLLMTKLRVAWDVKALHSLPMKIVDIVHSSQNYALMFITFANFYGLFNERPAIAIDADGDLVHVRRHSPDEIKRRAKVTYFAVWGGLALAAIGVHLRNRKSSNV